MTHNAQSLLAVLFLILCLFGEGGRDERGLQVVGEAELVESSQCLGGVYGLSCWQLSFKCEVLDVSVFFSRFGHQF